MRRAGVDETDKQMYTNAYRCTIKGGWEGKPGADPLPEPQPPKACAGRTEECQKGPKQMLVWGQAEGNNISEDGHFNDDFGYADGAQNEIWGAGEKKKPVAKVLRRDEGGGDWDPKWYQQTWTEEELLKPWTEEEQGYIDRELHQHWEAIMNEKDYDYLDVNSLSVPAQYIVRKLRAQLWLATHINKPMPQTEKPQPAQTKAPEPKPTAAEAKPQEDSKAEIKADQPVQTVGPRLMGPPAGDAKKEDEKKKEDEAKKQAPKSISWEYVDLKEYTDALAKDGNGLAMKQIEYLNDAWREMQADENYPPDLAEWWKGLKDKFEKWQGPTPLKAQDGSVKFGSLLDTIKGKRGEPQPTPVPRSPDHSKREMNIDSDKVLVNTLQNVQTTKLLLFNPNAAQEAKTEGVYTTKATGPAPKPVATLRGPPANAQKPSPTSSAWKPSGTYASLFGYLIDEARHDPNFRISPAQLRWIKTLQKVQEEGNWDGEWTEDIWNALFDMRHKQRKRWFGTNNQGQLELRDWDTRTYRDPAEIERYVRKITWTDDEIRGISEAEMNDYNALVEKVTKLGGWNSGALTKPDKELDEQSHLRWPEILLLRKIRFAKKKLRESVKKYFDEHKW